MSKKEKFSKTTLRNSGSVEAKYKETILWRSTYKYRPYHSTLYAAKMEKKTILSVKDKKTITPYILLSGVNLRQIIYNRIKS